MPIYEYKCEKCSQNLEALQQVSEPPLTTCPECGGALKKLLSAPAFQFKGTGWYVTDYADKKSGGASREEESGKDSGKKAPEGDGANKKEKKEKKAAGSDA